MARFLALLLNMRDPVSTGYILRTIRSPKGRYDVMKGLLEKAPVNKAKDQEHDRILAEFWSINQRRNAYVHGHWYTSDENYSSWLLEPNDDDHGFGLTDARPVARDELVGVIERIDKLVRDLLGLVQREWTKIAPK